MTDAQIDEYIASVRRWPKRPTDFGPETEAVIRRYLRGEIVIGPDGNIGSCDPEREPMEAIAELCAEPSEPAPHTREPAQGSLKL